MSGEKNEEILMWGEKRDIEKVKNGSKGKWKH